MRIYWIRGLPGGGGGCICKCGAGILGLVMGGKIDSWQSALLALQRRLVGASNIYKRIFSRIFYGLGGGAQKNSRRYKNSQHLLLFAANTILFCFTSGKINNYSYKMGQPIKMTKKYPAPPHLLTYNGQDFNICLINVIQKHNSRPTLETKSNHCHFIFLNIKLTHLVLKIFIRNQLLEFSCAKSTVLALT